MPMADEADLPILTGPSKIDYDAVGMLECVHCLRSTSVHFHFYAAWMVACMVHSTVHVHNPKSVRTNGNRSEQMEIGPNTWKSIQTNGN